MRRQSKRLQLASLLTVSAALLFGQPAVAQTPAELAPADAAVFIHIKSPNGWFGDLTQGPIGEKMRKKIETQEGSGDMLAALGMNIDQFMVSYFGEDLVIVGPGDDKDGVVFTKVSAENRARAITSLGLKRQGAIAGNPMYIGPDGDGYFVMMDNWVAMCELNAVDYMTKLIERDAESPSLADTDHYARWTTELPANRAMTALFINGEDDQHALGVIRQVRGMDATYLGISPNYNKMKTMFGENEVADFGPLPANTIGAMTFNLAPGEGHKKDFAMLDAMLGGKSFVDDIMPKLDAPTLMFMSSVSGDKVTPKVGVEVPVFGMAVKMSDDTVATDLKMMMDRAVAFANLAVMQYDAGMIPQRVATHKDASFQVAEVGVPVSRGLGWAEIAPIQLAYGQVGDYYMVCTQEQYFKAALDANAAGKAMRIPVEGAAHRLAVTPIMAMTVRPDSFAQMMRSWIKMIETKGLPEAVTKGEDQAIDIEGLYDIAGMMQQYSRMKMQVWTGEDGLIIGRAQLTSPQ